MYCLDLSSLLCSLRGSSVLSMASFFFFFKMSLVPSRTSAGFVDAWYEPLSRTGLSDVASVGRIIEVSQIRHMLHQTSTL